MRNVFLAREILFLFTELEIKRRRATTKMKLIEGEFWEDK